MIRKLSVPPSPSKCPASPALRPSYGPSPSKRIPPNSPISRTYSITSINETTALVGRAKKSLGATLGLLSEDAFGINSAANKYGFSRRAAVDAMDSMIQSLADGSVSASDLIQAGALKSLNGLISGGLLGEKDIDLSISALEVVATILSRPEVQSAEPDLLGTISIDLERMAPSIFMAIEEHVGFLETSCISSKSKPNVTNRSESSSGDSASPPSWLLDSLKGSSSNGFWQESLMDLGKMAVCCCLKICNLPLRQILGGPASLPFIPMFAKVMRLTSQAEASNLLPRPLTSIQPDQMSLVCLFKLVYNESGPCERAMKELLLSGESVHSLCAAMKSLSEHRTSLDIAGALLLDLTSMPDAHLFLAADHALQAPPLSPGTAAASNNLAPLTAIASLVKTMKDDQSCPDVRMGAALALGRLAAKSRACQMDAVREGVLPALTSMMKATHSPMAHSEGVGYLEERAHGARLLTIIAQPTPTHGHILARSLLTVGDGAGDGYCSVLDVVVDLLKSTLEEIDPPLAEKGMGGLLGKIRKSSEGVVTVKPGGGGDQSQLLSIIRHSAGALAILAHNPHNHHELLNLGVCPLLVQILRTIDDAKVQSNALSCLMSLSSNDERSAAVVVRSGAIPVVLRMVERATVDIERRNYEREQGLMKPGGAEGGEASKAMVGDLCTCLISSLCRYQVIQTELVHANGTEALLGLLGFLADPAESRWNGDQAANVCEALSLLASSGNPEHVTRLIVRSDEIVKSAKVLLSSANPSVRYWTNCLLSALCNDDQPAFVEEMLCQGIQYQLINALQMDSEVIVDEKQGLSNDAEMWADAQRLDGALSRVQAAWLISKIASSDVEGVGEGGAASLVRAGAVKPLVLLLQEALSAERKKNGGEGFGRIKRRRSSEGGSSTSKRLSRTTLSPSSAREAPQVMEIDGGWIRQFEKGAQKEGVRDMSSSPRELGLSSNALAASRSALLALGRCGGSDARMKISVALAEVSWVEGGVPRL